MMQTAPVVSPELVDATWRRVATLSPSEALGVQQRSGKLQPEIVGFVIGFTSDLRPDAVGLALYVMLVVVELFRTAPVRKLVKVRDSTISRHWTANAGLVREARGRDPNPTSAATLARDVSEPHVFHYVIEALTEENPDDPVALSADEAWHLIAVLKTVVDSLHDGCRV